MNISYEQSMLVYTILYLVGFAMALERVRWVNKQYLNPFINIWLALLISAFSWIIVILIGLWIGFDMIKDFVEDKK